MPYAAKILADSISLAGARLTTMEITYPRFVHSEFMTHRLFCLAGDSTLEFDLPAGQNDGARRRLYKMTLQDFVSKWIFGSKPHRSRWGGERTYDLKGRLREMQIRQLNEATGEIETSTVIDAMESGLKPVYEVRAGKYVVAGSADHRVMTTDGWKTIGELTLADALVVRSRKKPDNLKKDPLRLKKIDGMWRSRWQIQERIRLITEDPKCRTCHKREGVDIHHVEHVHLAPQRAFDPTNITLLCELCHADEHRKQGWQEGNPLYAAAVAVESIRFRGVEPTYDLSIAGPFPNFIANGVVVHNSRNAASSRAIPIGKMIERVETDPAMPVYWGKNQKGMQAAEELTEVEQLRARNTWLDACGDAVRYVKHLSKLGLHKQIANRLLEPWMWITVIVSATEWENFFHLRCHPDAQPEIRRIADMMKALYDEHTPIVLKSGEWHRPLVDMDDVVQVSSLMAPIDDDPLVDAVETILNQISVGRCARVSYLTHDGKRDHAADIELHDRLAKSGHWSPFEHVATPAIWQTPSEDPMLQHRSGNFRGWIQYRKKFATEHAGRETRLP